MPAVVTPNERRLLGLLRRLLRHSEKQQVQLDNANRLIRRLREVCQVLQGRLERREADHAATEEASEIFLGAALDELTSGTPGDKP